MIFREILPSIALRPFVQNYLLVNLNSTIGYHIKPYPTRIEQALAFFGRGGISSHDLTAGNSYKVARSAVFGQQVSRLNFQNYYGPDFLMLMVIFQPGAMYRLLGIPNHELTATYHDASALIHPELLKVSDQIAEADSYDEMIERAEEFLIGKIRKVKKESSPIDKIGLLLQKKPTQFSLDWLASQACLSPRQFERKFSERMGIGPKLYSRISRFYQAFQYKEMHPHLDWLSVAVHFGYSDYDHLAKDFKQFANVTPNLLLKENAQRPEIIVDL